MKGLKISVCTLFFVLLSACGISGNHQESAAGSDTDVSLEEQESNSQTEDVNTSISQEEVSQVSEYEEKNDTVLQIQVKDSNHTIIFELNGSLAYFSPWGNVVMYYSDYGSYHGLYHLGNAVSGSEWISELTGTLDIQQIVEK